MARRNTFLIFAAGLLTGVVGMIALSGGHTATRAMAQGGEPAQRPGVPTTPGRFQVAAWAYPASQGPGGPISASYGAFILDTQTGKAWRVKEFGKPEPIGGVE